MQLTCLDEDGKPVHAGAEFFFDLGGAQFALPADGNKETGQIEIPTMNGHLPRHAIVTSYQGHWKTIVELSPSRRCTMKSVRPPEMASWWRRLVGRSNDGSQLGRGIRVGIIDLAFRPSANESNIRCFDIEGEEIGSIFPDVASHGQRVARVVAQQSEAKDRQGIAPGCEVFLVDVSKDEDLSAWDYEKIGPAINLLVNVFGVDLINISGGAKQPKESNDFVEATELLLLEIERARNKGTSVVAAVGNDKKAPPAIPSCFDTVIGVGAVGQCGVAPPGTMVNMYQRAAYDTQWCVGRVSDDVEVFHYIDTASGKGLDVVGPGIGVFLEIEDGRVIEYAGTSYAAPVVTGVWACILAKDHSYERLPIEERVEEAWKRLRRSCVDLGMSADRQGLGLPLFA